MKILKYLAPYLKSRKIFVITYLTSNIMLNFTLILIPTLSGKFIDNLISSMSKAIINEFVLFLITIGILQLFLNFCIQQLEVNYISVITFEINKDIINHLKKVPLSELKDFDIAGLSQRNFADSQSITDFFFHSCVTVISNIFAIFLSFLLLCLININIALILLVFLIIYLIFYKGFKQQLYKHNHEFKNMTSIYFSKIQSQLHKIKLVKLYNLYEKTSKELIAVYRVYQDCLKKFVIASYIFNSGDSILSLSAQLTIFIMGGHAVIEGRMTIGTFTVLISYFNIMISSTKNLSTFMKSYIDTSVSYNRIMELMNIRIIEIKDETIDNLLQISLDSICFSYYENIIFYNFSYTFEKGKIYCLVGRNGCGKSTMLDILSNIIDKFDSGSIYFNDTLLNDLNKEKLYDETIAYLPQESVLIEGTIYNNIHLDDDENDPCALNNIYNQFRLKDVEFKDLKCHLVTDEYQNLSGGEIKKICLMRTLLKRSQLILLDEPTNYLDSKSRNNMLNILNDIKHEKIIIIASHDDKIINMCDEVLDITKNH